MGKVAGPFSAHRHLRFQRGLSHATLAQGVAAMMSLVMRMRASEIVSFAIWMTKDSCYR